MTKHLGPKSTTNNNLTTCKRKPNLLNSHFRGTTLISQWVRVTRVLTDSLTNFSSIPCSLSLMSYTYSSTLFLASFLSFSSLSCMIILPWGEFKQQLWPLNTLKQFMQFQMSQMGGFIWFMWWIKVKLPHFLQKGWACHLLAATVDCFQWGAPAVLFWLWASWLVGVGRTSSHFCPPLWQSEKLFSTRHAKIKMSKTATAH